MTDTTESTALLIGRLRALERRVVRLQAALAGGALALCTVGIVAFTSWAPVPPPSDVVSAHRLVLVDSQGKAGATIELGSDGAEGTPGALEDRQPALKISLARKSSGSTTDSLAGTRTELRLSGRSLSVMFGLVPHVALRSGLVFDARPSLTLLLGKKPVYRIDPYSGSQSTSDPAE
jgi:hypothetical protein